MKKLFLLSVFFLAASTFLFSQKFHGGVTAGLAATQVAGDTYSGFNKAGIFMGGYVNLDISKRSALQMELTYFQKGSRANPDSTNNFQQYKFRANYIEMPLLYMFKAGKFIVHAGPSLGFLMGYFEEADYFRLDDKEGYNKPAAITLQINLGMRYYFTEKFGADFRTNNSLLNIRSRNATGDVWRIWTYGQFHDSLVISLFYQFK